MQYNKKDTAYGKTLELIKRYDFNFKKKYGQNFLIDDNILEKIVSGANVENEVVIEIGPGIGTLSRYLAKKVKKLIVIEIDKKLIPVLEENLLEFDNIEIINEDVLKVDFDSILKKYNVKEMSIVANLPYYITTPIIMKLLEDEAKINSITVMVQKEVALRMNAKESTKDYGALTLAINYYTRPNILFTVSPNCFIPKPNVESAVIRLECIEKRLELKLEKFVFKLIHAAFNQRRKTLVNALCNNLKMSISKNELENILIEIGFSGKVRGENLTLDDYIKLANKLIFYENVN